MANESLLFKPGFLKYLALLIAAGCAGAATTSFALNAAAQHPSQASQATGEAAISGSVIDAGGKPVSGAPVRLRAFDSGSVMETVTDAFGRYRFPSLRFGKYEVSAEQAGLRSHTSLVVLSSSSAADTVLTLETDEAGSSHSASPPRNPAALMEFSDKPNFTIAGVTDWTAVGGHGSDSPLRTSEDLARATLTLKQRTTTQAPAAGQGRVGEQSGGDEQHLRAALSAAPKSYAANRALGEYYLHTKRYRQAIPFLQAASTIQPAQAGDEYDLALACQGAGDIHRAQRHAEQALRKKDTADAHRLAGELDEALGDPLSAVRQFEVAARMDPSEENYFAWGSELLLHRAVWQAAEVFKNGANAHPRSARILTGWGAALFAGALYDEAAQRLCEASDLNPADPEPYLFMGKVELAAPAPLACVEQKLLRFVQTQPDNAQANYLYAMSLSKRENQPDPDHVESLLTKAATLDPKCSQAYLQLGIIAFDQHAYAKAIDLYTKALAADPELAEAHYRLGVAYSRAGDAIRARQQFQLHDELEKAQAAAVEAQRREVKQFLVVLSPAHATKE